jgi:hypothetical protein
MNEKNIPDRGGVRESGSGQRAYLKSKRTYSSKVRQMGSVAVNVVESRSRLCKTITLAGNGKLQIEGAVQPYEGVIRTVQVASMQGLSDVLADFKTHQALACCNTSFPRPVSFTTKAGLTEEKVAKGVIARTQGYLKWMPGPALLPLDHDDKGATPLTLPSFNTALVAIFPHFADAARLVTWSSSSSIYLKHTGEKLRGPGSFHTYNVIADGADMERFVRVLQQRLWLAGSGHIWIDKVGKMHVRTIIDGAIYGSQGLMFEAPAELGERLEQRRPAPDVREGTVIDTAGLKDLTTEEESRYAKLVTEAKRKAVGEAKKIARDYEAVEVEKLVARHVPEPDARAAVKARLKGELAEADLLFFDHCQLPTSVATVLANPEHYDGKTLADPIEPDYMGTPGSVTKGKAQFFANAETGQPMIHSFAHGGRTFKLPRHIETLADRARATSDEFGDDGDDGYEDAPEAQGESARKPAVPSWIKNLNRDYGVMDTGGVMEVWRLSEDGQIARYKFTAFREKFCNHFIQVGVSKRGDPIHDPLGKVWLEHWSRREYAGFVFDASGHELSPNIFNLWRGYGVKRAPGDWSLLKAHMLDVICNGNREHYDYLLKLLAWKAQNPHLRTEIVLVLRSEEEGTGKNELVRWYGPIFGNAWKSITNPEQLFGRFNDMLLNACVVSLDEMLWAGDHSKAGRFKTMITEPMVTLEGKWKSALTIENSAMYIVTSNEDWVVPAGRTARRFFVLEVSDKRKGDESYFEALGKQRDNGGIEAFLDSLLAMDLKDWHPRKGVPQTEALVDQKHASMTWLEKFIEKVLDDGDLIAADHGRSAATDRYVIDGETWKNGVVEADRDDFENAYLEWQSKRRGGTQHRADGRRVIGKKLKQMLGVGNARPWQTGGPRKRVWVLPPLAECRTTFSDWLSGRKGAPTPA